MVDDVSDEIDTNSEGIISPLESVEFVEVVISRRAEVGVSEVEVGAEDRSNDPL